MSTSKYLMSQPPPSFKNRYGGTDRAVSEARHFLYLSVRDHIRAGWNTLPPGLTAKDLREIAEMAKVRRDHAIFALCHQSVC